MGMIRYSLGISENIVENEESFKLEDISTDYERTIKKSLATYKSKEG